MPIEKYRSFKTVSLPNRQWPSRTIQRAPIWCSVDLRDGNQALHTPMNIEQKLQMFELLVEMGFKEIEVGFPAAAEVEYLFLRKLIEEQRIPDDVTIQVLTQTRNHLIERTFEALEGVSNAIVHIYNSTSTIQRRVVFNSDRAGIIDIAVKGAEFTEHCAKFLKDTNITYQYSPESFTGTELDFALEICEAVLDVWQPTARHKAIINLPATVEMSTPNVFADRVEWFGNNLRHRETVILSVHTHNDRGTGVAASELALLAGADRVEGTLFGNGERTGNLDITTMGLNLFTQGIDPKLNFHDINHITKVYEQCTGMDVHQRHPYAGELVYTAFSGSHQDAIRKGMQHHEKEKATVWDVPYLPMDPQDVGRTYESIIRINSQSGKGGVAYIMETEFGYYLPKGMHPEFSRIIQKVTEKSGEEASPQVILEKFKEEYLSPQFPLEVVGCQIKTETTSLESSALVTNLSAVIKISGDVKTITGIGNGPLDAFCTALRKDQNTQFNIINYYEHALEQGSDAKAVAYVQIAINNSKYYGVGVDANISLASIRGLSSALNRAFHKESQLHEQFKLVL